MQTVSNNADVLLYFSLEYLKQIAGPRTVPVELGSHYTSSNWSQKLMTLSDFIDTHVTMKVSAITMIQSVI